MSNENIDDDFIKKLIHMIGVLAGGIQKHLLYGILIRAYLF
jgi:hypothetical protein